ncbi:MAG: hypothetical protein ABIG28_01070 [archaeon]
MHKFSPWLFIIIALMWLLPEFMTEGTWMTWVAIIAMALVGVLELINK